MAAVTLDAVRDQGARDAFPCGRLSGCETGLALFAARWLGKQDCVWLADAGIETTCVDVDDERLREMFELYPAGWEFVTCDAFAFADWAVENDRRWDVVTLDPFTDLFDRVAGNVETWCALARRMVVMGTGRRTRVKAPAGWRVTARNLRSSFQGGVYWTVLERR